MPAPIYVFHRSERERDVLDRDLRAVGFEVTGFATSAELVARHRHERAALVLWDLDEQRVRGGLDELSRRLECPVLGLASEASRPRPEERPHTLLLPFERWRVAPLALRVLASREHEKGEPREVVRHLRVMADTVRDSIFRGLDADREEPPSAPRKAADHVPMSPLPRALPEPPPLPVAPPPLPAAPPPLPPAPPLPVAAEPPPAPRASARRATAPVIPSADGARPRVLLADDDSVLRHILGYQLESSGYEVITTDDGAQAERLLREGAFVALLVDLNLPHKNGFELLERLHPDRDLPRLRVIMLSEQSQEDKIVRALDLGAHDFIQKPLNPRVVVSRLQRLLRDD